MSKSKKTYFEFPYQDEFMVYDDFDVIEHKENHKSVMFKCTNTITQYSGDESLYQDFHNTLTSILKSLQEGFYFQKHDIFSTKTFDKNIYAKEEQDFLQEEYFKKFDGKEYKGVTTYITLTKERKRGVSGKPIENREFLNVINKVQTILKDKGYRPKPVRGEEFARIFSRFCGLHFSEKHFSNSNHYVNKKTIVFGSNKFVRSKSLIDNEEVDLPNTISPSTTVNLGYLFPVDLFSFLNEVQNYNEMVYHQVIYIPNQKEELLKLDGKKRKHSSMPGASNEKAFEDIENVEKRVSNDKQLLVYAHFNIVTSAESEADLNRVSNFIDSSLFDFGITPSKRCTNQEELFRSIFPGNPTVLNKKYDRFWSTSNPMICFLFKEKLQESNNTDFKLYFSDRQGIPISIDTWEQPQVEGKINNRNAFVLGPSGSGKSFLTNHKLRQYARQNVDVVIIDTGHSYEGLCNYQGGRYITYTEEKPITMNPFKVNRAEYNEEKREFLKSLITVLWKGTATTLSQVEDTAIGMVINDYYNEYFNHSKDNPDGTTQYGLGDKVQSLSFNTFYEYSIVRLEEISENEKIRFEIKDYGFILKKFYKGGQYETILNNDLDSSLFDEKFVVFEIDAIKEHKTLFPITTLIIMDVFIQKMRLKSNKKALIIEEAWKAIASPTMAGYILYLYKTVRKWNGQVTVVTQELNDILGNEIVKDSILGNSDLLYLLDQAKIKDNYDEVAKLLNLSEVEQNKIFTINSLDNKRGRSVFKEVYIRIGTEGQVVGVEVSQAEYFAYTTERSEKEALRVYVDVFPKVSEALKAFIYDLQKSKLKTSLFVKHINQTKKTFSNFEEQALQAS